MPVQIAETGMSEFHVGQLGVLNYFNSFSSWVYQAGAYPLADVRAEGYFDAAADMFATGDIVLVTGETGATMLHVAVRDGHVILSPVER
jgi:hypothetical protein